MSDNARHSKLPSTFRIAERIRNGESKPDMAAQCGVSVNTLNRHLRAAGWNGDGTPKPAPLPPRAPAAERNVTGPRFRIPEDAELPCRKDPEAWFPKANASKATVNAVKALCRTCPIREACLEFAIGHDDIQDGIWAGYAARSIRKIRANRKAAA